MWRPFRADPKIRYNQEKSNCFAHYCIYEIPDGFLCERVRFPYNLSRYGHNPLKSLNEPQIFEFLATSPEKLPAGSMIYCFSLTIAGNYSYHTIKDIWG